ncbi:hypothetical protein KFK09_014083 [Dendrobium nobile]|uniref:Uncharacterized protein n=1 Tax=Dendrobium nobile TaxID=94219 RepID=A0A8T3BAQ5_DENNO|nr:hypothetical protein KFK09_014083 [Dendrobium nobile]
MAEALKDFSSTVAELQDKNDSLEKELISLRNNEAEIQKLIQVTSNQIPLHNLLNREIMKFEKKKKDCVRLEGEIENLKDCTALSEKARNLLKKRSMIKWKRFEERGKNLLIEEQRMSLMH